MKEQYVLDEEYLKQEYNIKVSIPVNTYINHVIFTNRNNPDAVKQFNDSYTEAKEHLKYRNMAFGYPNQNRKQIKTVLRELGLEIYYFVQFDEYGQPYVSIYRIKIDFNYFGLIPPPPLQQTNINAHRRIQEHPQRRISQIITETINTFIAEDTIRKDGVHISDENRWLSKINPSEMDETGWEESSFSFLPKKEREKEHQRYLRYARKYKKPNMGHWMNGHYI